MNSALIREFKPTIFFLLKFVGSYFVLNILYGFYINSYSPDPDPLTQLVTEQTSFFLNVLGENTTASPSFDSPNVYLTTSDQSGLSVYEGCNGLNTMIVFVAFLLAYGKMNKKLLWFIPAGLLVIHVFNIFRIGGLYFVTFNMPDYLYFTHKYLFTAFLFLVIFVMWFIWVNKVYSKQK